MDATELEWVLNPSGCELWELALEAYLTENWTPCREFYDIWRRGFGEENLRAVFVLHKVSRRLLGTIQVALLPPTHAAPALVTVGDFWVAPECRGQGLGLRLWDQAFSCARFRGPNCGLMAALAMSDKYARGRGFDQFYRDRVVHILIDTNHLIPEALCTSVFDGNVRIVEKSKVDFEQLAVFDAGVAGGLRRDRLLQVWLTAPNVVVCLAAIDDSGRVHGLLLLTAGPGDRLATCPFYAHSPQVAEALLGTALQQIDLRHFGSLKFMPFESNTAAFALFNKVSLNRARELRRSQGQFTQKAPPVAFGHVYGCMELALHVV